MRLFASTALAVLLSAATATTASATEYVLDKSHAAITFEVSHFGFSNTMGRFNDFDAEVNYDPDNPAGSSVTFTIEAASVDTNWEPRDKHIRSKDFFNVDANPTITFVSKSVALDGDDKATLVGDLTFNGVTNEETFAVELHRQGKNPVSGKMTAGFRATATIDRTAYGISTYAPAIGAEIPVVVDLEIVAK